MSGPPIVQMVILGKWKIVEGNRVTGHVEFYKPGERRPQLRQSLQLLPKTDAVSSIEFTWRELYGSAVPEGRDPDKTQSLSVEVLYEFLIPYLKEDNLIPA
ncbi:hypothetical protein BDV59DRAFT_200423 [Aspergillus ambiguus]|uniref:uncharacterized protein n=1 Tax=Aspergillus ambiguus TaxID=176160 RepID=UPI003CCCD7E3